MCYTYLKIIINSSSILFYLFVYLAVLGHAINLIWVYNQQIKYIIIMSYSVPQPQLSKALISNLLRDSGTEHRQLAMTCSATLQELAPSPSLDDLSVSEIVDNDKSGIDLLPLLLIQVSGPDRYCLL